MARRKTKDVADQRSGRPNPAEPKIEFNSQRWWKMRGREAAGALWNWSDTRRAYLRGYHALDLIHEAIYEGRPVGRHIGSAAMDFLRAQSQASSYLNVLQSMVDTVVSRQGRRRPMPIIGCDDAEYSEKLYARRGSRVLRRKMGQPVLERMFPMVLRDAVVRGDGCGESIRVGGDVTVEKFPRCELVHDDGEARDGMPRTLARVKLVDKDTLCAQYPKHADRIRKLSPAARDVWSPYDYDAPIDFDQVEVIKGWRLPSFPGAGDGYHVITVRDGGEPLRERDWGRMRFPVGRMQWTPGMRGFLGIGLIQQLAGSQNKVNDLWNDHQEALYWASSLKIFQPRSSNINKHEMRARHPAIVETDGPVPAYIAPNPASVQAMESLQWLIQQMYEISGISQAAAASKNPLGPQASGKALDTMYDMESDRFSQLELQYAMGRCDFAMCMLDEAKDLARDARDDKTIDLAPWIEEIDWEKFDFDGGSYHLNIEPINFLPESRAGKLDALADMGKIPGLLTNPLQTASLFDEPDIARANRHLLGPYRMLERLMEMLGDEDVQLEDCVPTPQMDQQLAKEMALGELGNAYSEGASDSVQGRYRWFLSMLEGMQPPPAPAMPPGMPGPAPMPTGPMGDLGGGVGPAPMPTQPTGIPPNLAPIMGPRGGIEGTIPDPMGGATAQLAAGMGL